MNYPLISEYVQSIKFSDDNFDRLSNLRPVLDSDGSPIMSSGNFAVVFKMEDEQNGKFYAVKCFLRDQDGRADSYKKISSELEYVSSTFLTPIRYLENELFVNTNQGSDMEFPVLLMDWVEGMTLDKYVRSYIHDQYRLSLISYQFCRMGSWLLSQEFAHGDLKPDNIIVRDDGLLVLVDYDGMYVPAMNGEKSRELGSEDYRHPLRTEEVFNGGIDDFSIASIALSLKAISLKPELLEEYGAEDRLLLSSKDYRDIGGSDCLKAICSLSDDAELAQLLGLFYIAHARNELGNVSFKLFNLVKPENVQAVTQPKCVTELALSTEVTEEDLRDAVVDEFGVVYSWDGLKLLLAPKDIQHYKVKERVVVISDGAFADCESLYDIVFPSFLTAIGDNAFEKCWSLQEVVLPSSLISIGCNAFNKCYFLSKVILPSSLKNIGGGVFNNCYRLTLYSYNPEYSVIDNCLLVSNKGKKVISYFGSEEKVLIPSSLACIGDHAFQGSSLKEVVFPSSLTSIGDWAFVSSSLRKVILPTSLISIGVAAFGGCAYLQSITLPVSLNSMGDNAFAFSNSLNSIIVPKGETERFTQLLRNTNCDLSRIKEQDK